MTVNVGYVDGAGEEQVISAQQVAQHLTEAGHQGVAISPDGMTITMQGPEGAVAAPLRELVGESYGKVQSLVPTDVDYSTVDPLLRAKLETLPDIPGVREAFLKSSIQAQPGMEGKDFEIVGNGGDYFFFDPSSGRYKAITNKPGLDLSDAAGAAPGLLRGIGATAGGLLAGGLAAPTGVGAIAAGAAGAGAAGLGTQGLIRTALGATDDAYRDALSTYGAQTSLTQRLADEAPEALLDAAGGAVIPGLRTLAGPGVSAVLRKGAEALRNPSGVTETVRAAQLPIISKVTAARDAGLAKGLDVLASGADKIRPLAEMGGRFLDSGTVAPVLRGTGRAVQPAATLVDKAAGFAAESPLVRSLTAQVVPGLGQADLAANLMQLPKFAPWATKTYRDMLAKGAGADEALQALAGPRIDKLDDLLAARSIGTRGADDAANQFFRTGTTRGAKPASSLAEETGSFYGNLGEKLGRDGDAWARFGRGAGNVARTGEQLEGLVHAPVKAGFRAIQAGAKTTKAAGGALAKGANAVAPLENKLYTNQGLQWLGEDGPAWWDRQKQRFQSKELSPFAR